MKKRIGTIGFASIVVLALVARFLVTQETPVVFEDLKDALNSIKAQGFHCTTDREDGQMSSGFVVSREELPWEEVNSL